MTGCLQRIGLFVLRGILRGVGMGLGLLIALIIWRGCTP